MIKMDLVIDSNRLFAALIKDSTCRHIILSNVHRFYAPKELMVEFGKYFDLLEKKSKLKRESLLVIFGMILDKITLIPINEHEKEKEKALEIMKEIDKKDAPFVAVALSITVDGIWSDDKHFDQQDEVKVYKTKDLLFE